MICEIFIIPVEIIIGFLDFRTFSISGKKLLSLDAILIKSAFLIKKSALSKSNGVEINDGPFIVNGYSANATAFNVTSDDRLKHNEEDLTDSLNVIRKLKPQKYQKTKEMKEADFNGTLTEGEYVVEAGFIAQDILNDIPELSYSVREGGTETRTTAHVQGSEPETLTFEKPYSRISMPWISAPHTRLLNPKFSIPVC